MQHSTLLSALLDPTPRPGLQPIPGTIPLTLEAIICPPLVYYVALLFLPPAPPPTFDTVTVKILRNVLALLAGTLFFRLPLKYHVPQSIGLTYQLSLVGIYGGCRVVDAFFISPYLFGHIPRRVKYQHRCRDVTPTVQTPGEHPSLSTDQSSVDHKVTTVELEGKYEDSTMTTNIPTVTLEPDLPVSDVVHRRASIASLADSYNLLCRTITGPNPQPVHETATSEFGWPHSFLDRASWALELELSMRGVGFTWTTADVRHTRKTWLPTIANRLHSIFMYAIPILTVSFITIRHIYMANFSRLEHEVHIPSSSQTSHHRHPFDTLSLSNQLLLTASLGALLMSSFSLAHSLFAILLSPLSPHPLSFFPPLYSRRIWTITSVRGFWSYGWHRLFARLFLVYGVWPGEWIERKLLRKTSAEKADVGKVLGGFAASAVVHCAAVRSVLGGDWQRARGEASFFLLNGFAVVFEEVVKRAAFRTWRRRRRRRRRSTTDEKQEQQRDDGDDDDYCVTKWDSWIGRIWWICVLLFSGRDFARGWVDAGLVREMAGR